MIDELPKRIYANYGVFGNKYWQERPQYLAVEYVRYDICQAMEDELLTEIDALKMHINILKGGL